MAQHRQINFNLEYLEVILLKKPLLPRMVGFRKQDVLSVGSISRVRLEPNIFDFSEKEICMQWDGVCCSKVLGYIQKFVIRNFNTNMNLNITSITFSQDLLFTINKFPRLVKANSEATYRLRFIPHQIGEIRALCTISTNMGLIEYQVRMTRVSLAK